MPLEVWAKRVAPHPVKPLFWSVYKIYPSGNGSSGKVTVSKRCKCYFKPKTITIYEINYLKSLESDVQDLHITKLEISNGNTDLNCIDTSQITSMGFVFYDLFGGHNCKDLNIDISGWDVSNVKNMNCMFWACENITFDISKWDVSKVTDMSSMFERCFRLFELDLNFFNTDNVQNMCNMFDGCSKLKYAPTIMWKSGETLNNAVSKIFNNCSVIIVTSCKHYFCMILFNFIVLIIN